MFSLLRAPALAATVAVALLSCTVNAIPKVTRSGRYLYSADGTRFYIKGIAYQEQGEVVVSDDNPFGEPHTYIDPLALSTACQRDIPYLTRLGVNALRIYSVDPTLNHDACMTALSAAGIYTIIDLATPLNGSIDRLVPSWSNNLLNAYIQRIDAFLKYDNVLAFNVGNEVITGPTTAVAPYVKAAARDVKAYLKSKNSDVLVGYAAINGAQAFRSAAANYLTCDVTGGGTDASAIDLFGLNDYTWCNRESFAASAYPATTADFANFNAVAYFSEYGCRPSQWTEVPVLFSSDMNAVWSGGIAFSYFPATSTGGSFGIVTVSGNTVTTGPDFDSLAAGYTAVTFINSPARGSSSVTYPTCAAPSTAFVASNTLPPTPNDGACACVQRTTSCQFTPKVADYSAVVGQLIGAGCTLLSQTGGNCLDIGGDGQTGVYGRLAGCDPVTKASYIMSQYYEANNRLASACDFSGNGTVNTAASATSSAQAVASSCIANPGATFASGSPVASGGTGGTTRTANTGTTSGTAKPSNAATTLSTQGPLVGLGAVSIVSLFAAVWALV